jgi:hypothetical protein
MKKDNKGDPMDSSSDEIRHTEAEAAIAHRSKTEITEELHALRALSTRDDVLALEVDRPDTDPLECLRAQLRVLQEQMSFRTVVDEFEEAGSDYILGAADDARRWLTLGPSIVSESEPAPPPSAMWHDVLQTSASVAA